MKVFENNVEIHDLINEIIALIVSKDKPFNYYFFNQQLVWKTKQCEQISVNGVFFVIQVSCSCLTELN